MIAAKPHRAVLMKGGELRRDLYARVAAQIDAMRLDSVLRFPVALAPSHAWFRDRAKLNGTTLARRDFEGQRIVVRIK